MKNVYIGTIRPHMDYGSTTLSSASKSIYTLDKFQNQTLRLPTRSMKSTPIRVMEETTAIQPLSKRRDMRNIIQAERYTCCRCLPTPLTIASESSLIFLFVVHQEDLPPIWPATPSLQRGLYTNLGVKPW